jgi:hypothetical protein
MTYTQFLVDAGGRVRLAGMRSCSSADIIWNICDRTAQQNAKNSSSRIYWIHLHHGATSRDAGGHSFCADDLCHDNLACCETMLVKFSTTSPEQAKGWQCLMVTLDVRRARIFLTNQESSRRYRPEGVGRYFMNRSRNAETGLYNLGRNLVKECIFRTDPHTAKTRNIRLGGSDWFTHCMVLYRCSPRFST